MCPGVLRLMASSICVGWPIVLSNGILQLDLSLALTNLALHYIPAGRLLCLPTRLSFGWCRSLPSGTLQRLLDRRNRSEAEHAGLNCGDLISNETSRRGNAVLS